MEILKSFVVFEGIDGSGTSTQMEILKSRVKAEGREGDFVFTQEPTDGGTGIFLRQVLSGGLQFTAQTAAYLFAADRAEHLWAKKGVVSLVRSGKTVVSDRYLFSSLAYQAATCGTELPRLLNRPFPLPEILFYFDLPVDAALSRISLRPSREIYETREMLEKTAAEYKKVIAEYEHSGVRIITLDAAKSAEEVHREITERLAL